MKKIINLDEMIMLLKVMAESSRLRLLALLYHRDLTVSDLTFVLGQPQSHVLQHLRLLYEAQLIEPYQKGGSIYFKLCHACLSKNIVLVVISTLLEHDVMVARDWTRLKNDRKEQHPKSSKTSFLQNAVQWDVLSFSSIAEHGLESALREIIGDKPFETMLDIGREGSVLKLFSGLYTHAVEVALDSEVLHLSVGNATFDLVILRCVLHFFENPEMAFHEIAGVLRPHGRLLIVDFVHYEAQSSHSYHSPTPFGFSDLQIEQWLKDAGLLLEQMMCFPPSHSENNKSFVVKLWLARDPRLLVDDIKDKTVEFA
ncbi:methyltransferase domain-containing protein [Bartonella senegalensis]|uniref:methyltransferase domain-containing protein n=1 Tax=Bartonella senegalensis TaxID=1468418 RepID=UPI00055CF5F6|nr:methyltransferase domain-containing protein [Bartonella senegalensis]